MGQYVENEKDHLASQGGNGYASKWKKKIIKEQKKKPTKLLKTVRIESERMSEKKSKKKKKGEIK